MSGSANDAVLGKHLNKLATRVANKLATISGGASVAVFTGAAANDGTSGLVPAPHAGDNMKFLRGDGTWAAFSGSVEDSVISADVSAVEGGFWQDIINNVPVLKLRHGDYEYNFNYDTATYLGSESTLVTVTPNTYVLDTASSTVDGGVWYEVNSNNVPQLKLHKGNYNYGFNYDSITYKGGSTNLVAYLPFDTSTTADACGNTWAVTGSPTINPNLSALYLAPSWNNPTYLTNSTISDSIGAQPWSVDFYAALNDTSGYKYFFGTYNTEYERGTTNSWVAVVLYQDYYNLQFYNNIQAGTIRYSDANRHFALTYDGATIRLFVDGVLAVAYEHQITLGGDFVIGGNPAGDNNGFSGSIDHFRIWRTAIWTENFTPPTTADYS